MAMERLSLKLTPRILIELTRSMAGRGGGRSCLSNLGRQNIISFDLFLFRLRLQVIAHSSIWVNSSGIVNVAEAGTMRKQSSAYFENVLEG